MRLKIGILGTRGIPNQYGGFEEVAEHLSVGLRDRGHEVIVYNSHKHPHQDKEWQGVPIVHCYDPEYILGTAGQFIYDLNCIMDARKRRFDVLLMLGYTSSSVWKSLFPRKTVVVSNMDGLEWKRTKYSPRVQRFLKYAEKLAVTGSHFHIADSAVIKEYLDEKYKINCRFIAYGADRITDHHNQGLKEFHLKPRAYFVLVARMEPENNIEMLLDGFTQSSSQKKFVVIGNISNKFGKHLHQKFSRDPRVVFANAIFDKSKLSGLISNCSLYFHGHTVGGTNPSLLEAMAQGAFIAAHNNEFNRSVLEHNGLYFETTKDVQSIAENHENLFDQNYISNNLTKIQAEYNWKNIIDKYESFLRQCCGYTEVKVPASLHMANQLIES